MDFSLKGKVAVITGGSEGIGRATALRFAELGATIAICARRAEVLEKTAAEARTRGAEVLTVVADASKADDMARFIEQTVQRFGRIDIVVNNAGGTGQSPFAAVEDAVWQNDIDIKMMAQVRTARAAIPHMKKQVGGRIINLNMVAAKQPGAEQFPTVVSRAAGLALTKALSKELAVHNILVNAVAVGKIKTTGHERRAIRSGLSIDEYYAKTGKTIPLGRMGEAEEVANVIAFWHPMPRVTLPAPASMSMADSRAFCSTGTSADAGEACAPSADGSSFQGGRDVSGAVE